MPKYYIKCKCGNDEFKYIEEVNMYICTKCDSDYDPHFHICDMITEDTLEDVDKIQKT
ncbi:hypothetical protein [Alkaliphilus pronyensis]|uniref:hypothetical protein n=1 Tax=Alkaliphilus pronyensis TaxID=1482732 RepID=UPI00186572A5|nr:hypothetical protein [Alkaliphilus pronyensis]